MGTVASYPFNGRGLSFLPAPVSILKVLWEVLRWFDGVDLTTVAVPAHEVVWPWHPTGLADGSFQSILFVIDVL